MKIRFAAAALGAGLLAAGCSQNTETPVAGTQPEPETPPIIAQQALAGVGKQGQKIRNHSGLQKIISGPASVLFNTRQKAVLEFSVPPLVQMFKATNGRFPKSHQEFMTDIVEANNLKLPELPEGAVYHFNSEKGELWVFPENEVPK